MRTGKILATALICMISAVCADAKIKILYGPYLQNVKADEATIVWESDTVSVGWVEIALYWNIMTGYLREASKSAGFTIQPSSLTPSEVVKEKVSFFVRY